MTPIFSRPSRASALLVIIAVASSLLAGASARAAPVLDFGVGAFVSLDAGGAHWFTDRSGPVTDSGVIIQTVSDTALGGSQVATTSAYASLGALGGMVTASTGGALLASAQGFDDLSWYSDLLVTGIPGTKVRLRFGSSLEGMLSAGGPVYAAYSGGVRSTAFVGGVPLADWAFDVLTSPGSFDVLAFGDFEYDVGSIVRISTRMTVGAHADIESSVTADAFHTSQFYVDVLTPGGSYVAGGGVIFPHLPGVGVVPEPGSLALMLMVGLVAVRARRSEREPAYSGRVPREASCK